MSTSAGEDGRGPYRLGVLNGDGIGPEITAATLRVLEAALPDDLAIEWVPLPMGWEAIRSHDDPLPPITFETLKACHAWIMGPHDSVSYPLQHQTKLNPSGTLRHEHELFANVRPARSFPGLPALIPNADLVIVRENTEGFYADRNMFWGVGEFMPTPDVALAVGVFTRQAAERVAHAACRLAMQRRQHLTIVHKCNVLAKTMGLFRDTVRGVAEQYPGLRVDDFHVDAMAALLVRRMPDFDVLVTENMIGDILSDLTAELVGSLGLAPSINAGDTRAMAQAAHGSAPDIAGRGIANPMGLLLSSTMLLRWLAERHEDPRLGAVATNVDAAVERAVAEGVRTADLGGSAGTESFADGVIQRLGAAVTAGR